MSGPHPPATLERPEANGAALRDPAGLLDRIPELEPLCADPFVRRAVASGNPFRVYRALWWARATFRLRAHLESLRALLRTRRAFAMQVKEGDRSLGAFTGFVGMGLVGRSEREDDGTLIKTSVFELVGIPVFPLGAYIVRTESRFGDLVSILYFARVPLSTGWWLWRRLWTTLAAAVMVSWAWHALETWLASRAGR